jgi:cobalt transporter subunit CbtB
MAGLLRPPSITSFLTYRLIHVLMALIGYGDVFYLCADYCHGLGVFLKKECHMSSITGLLDNVDSRSRSTVWKNKVMPVLLAGSLGLVLLYGAAFAETSALHNAAHDARHSAAFPCH